MSSQKKKTNIDDSFCKDEVINELELQPIDVSEREVSMKYKIKGMVMYHLASHPKLYVFASWCSRWLSWLYNLPGYRKDLALSENTLNLYVSKEHGLTKSISASDGKQMIPLQAFRASYQDEEDFSDNTTDIKAIAYYLPQFHAIPENDDWWGKGFTEWNNTRKAEPLFNGHYQPREPHDDIGYYDLSKIDVFKKQTTMAKRHGFHGFCFYHYWFHGKRLLGKPVDMLIENPDIDMSFCLCWANETWSKKWDGKDHHILIQQTFSPEDDINHIRFLAPYFKDPRYIRVHGKPMLLVYRISKLPNPVKTAERWRTWCRNNSIGDIYLVAVCHGEVYPHISLKDIGFDAYAAFPPHSFPCREITADKGIFEGGYRFDYASGVNSYVIPQNNSKLYEGCTLGWDNTARFGKKAQMYLNYSLASYYKWLRKNITYTRNAFPPEERYLFINAWNEWAEGAYLEPDKRYGYAYINTTSRAIFDIPLVDSDLNDDYSEMPVCNYSLNYNKLKDLIKGQADHSLVAINNYIDMDASILEFGPSSGYFTRYLKEEKNAIVDIVELNAQCAELAAYYACRCYIGDIEKYEWKQAFAGRSYDYIIFADVLEHLKDPWNVLKESTSMMKDNGAILISVPNIAHMQIIASLYNNDFSYADIGILDKTHLRFFTDLTLKEMINNAGLQVCDLKPILSPVLPPGCATRWNKVQVPYKLWRMLSKKQHAHVLQFVACCKKSD